MRVGFISSGKGSRPHYASFTPLIPKDIEVEYRGLELYSKSLYDIADKKEEIVRRIQGFVEESGLDGIMVTGAPTEVLNPGLMAELKAALDVPVTTALNAGIAALKAFSAARVLLLTPFEERLNEMILRHLESFGVTAVAPRPFKDLEDAIKLTPEEVRELTRNGMSAAGGVDAVYFQGAVLDPLKVLDAIEKELGLPVVASNPAMLWYILSQLQLHYRIESYGRLLEQWLPLPAGASFAAKS